MGTKLAPAEEELYRRTDEVLHYVWDPIGVAGTPLARDEYFGYLPQVFRLIQANASAEQIAAYLEEVTTVGMGLPANSGRALKVAYILLHWKETVASKFDFLQR